MSKKSTLSQALMEASGRGVGHPTLPSQQPAMKSWVAPTREGKKAITGFFDPAVSKQLKEIALQHDTTLQALLKEALNGLFEKYGRSQIA